MSTPLVACAATLLGLANQPDVHFPSYLPPVECGAKGCAEPGCAIVGAATGKDDGACLANLVPCMPMQKRAMQLSRACTQSQGLVSANQTPSCSRRSAVHGDCHRCMAGAGGLHGLAYVERFVHLCMHANTLGQKSKPCVHCIARLAMSH